MRRVAVAVVLAVFAASACSQWTDSVDSRSATAGLPTTLEDLEAHRWALDESDSSIEVAAEATRPTITFDADTVQGSAGCNLFRGEFTLDGDEEIDIEELTTTRRRCPAPAMRTESEFLNALESVTKVDHDDHDELVLRTRSTRLSFNASDPDD